jgi:hypothetical protein
MSVHKKLMAARITLQGMQLKKSGRNNFAGYNYFELGDFIPAVQNIFLDAGLCGVICYGKDLAILTITDTEDMTALEITSPMSSAALKGCHEVQNLGAVETYIRRYLWVTAMEIVEHDALEATTGRDKLAKKGSSIPDTFRSSPTQGAMDKIPLEEQEYLRDLALELIALISTKEDADAFQKYESEHLDDEQKIAIWSILDSKTRSAIKRFGQQAKEAA